MGLNSTPSSDRIHIGFFGRRNAGKSSIVNAVTGQELAVVSEIKGTTTDPVQKAMELLPMGPAVIIDTPGIDDSGELGELRIRKTRQVLNKTDVAVLVVDGTAGISEAERQLAGLFQEKEIPFAVAMNKADLCVGELSESLQQIGSALGGEAVLAVSAKTGYQIQELKDKIAGLAVRREPDRRIVGDLIQPLDFVVLVTPIDDAAPKGRLILPQQQTIRDILEAGGAAVAVKDTELQDTLARLGTKPALVITDSQAFQKVSVLVPPDIPLTSFSILFARYKGNLDTVVQGARTLDLLRDGDTVLISEGCTHHRQCEDIGTVKLPGWIRKHTGKELHFEFTSGIEFPDDLSRYRLIIHCGGCTLNEREMKYRLQCACDQNVPITNYGTAIAHMNGILSRSIAPLQ